MYSMDQALLQWAALPTKLALSSRSSHIQEVLVDTTQNRSLWPTCHPQEKVTCPLLHLWSRSFFLSSASAPPSFHRPLSVPSYKPRTWTSPGAALQVVLLQKFFLSLSISLSSGLLIVTEGGSTNNPGPFKDRVGIPKPLRGGMGGSHKWQQHKPLSYASLSSQALDLFIFPYGKGNKKSAFQSKYRFLQVDVFSHSLGHVRFTSGSTL